MMRSMASIIVRNNGQMLMIIVVVVVVFVAVTVAASLKRRPHSVDAQMAPPLPCRVQDTVNVSDGMTRLDNGSYLHDGLVIPSHLVARYDHIAKNAIATTTDDATTGVGTLMTVPWHWRACLCHHLRPCIRLCCAWGTVYNNNRSRCMNTSDARHRWPAAQLNVTAADGRTMRSVNIFQHFAVQVFRPCAIMYALVPQHDVSDRWQLFENGTLYRFHDRMYLSKEEYCFAPTLINDSDLVYVMNPNNCVRQSEYGTIKIINAYAMLFSIPFMLATIVVYLSIGELRNQHGKSLVCYLLGLIIGYTLLSCMALLGTNQLTTAACKIMGYTAYFFFMAAFFWLSVISFDLWHNLRVTQSINRAKEKRRFVVYSLYAWGLAGAFLLLTWLAQEYVQMAEHYKPGINGAGVCWLNMLGWSAMIYFFGPILLIILGNVILFVMTATKIYRVQKELARIIAREDSASNLRSERDRYGLFLRLFVVMGVTWSLEIISYFVGSDKAWAKVFYISDICNAVQGFIIFMLFVMKKKVRTLIANGYSWKCQDDRQRFSQCSTKTNVSNVIASSGSLRGATINRKDQFRPEGVKETHTF